MKATANLTLYQSCTGPQSRLKSLDHSGRWKPCTPNQDGLVRKSRFGSELLIGQGLQILEVQSMRQTSRPNDIWKPFLKVSGYVSSYTVDARGAIAYKASQVIASLLPLASKSSIASSDDSQTLLSVSLEGLPDGDMAIDYPAFGEWLADRALGLRSKSPPSAWIQHCVHVLNNLFPQHSFFVCKNIDLPHDEIYGFGPRDLVKNDIMVDSDASSWKQGSNSMGFAIHPFREDTWHSPNHEICRLIGSCWILGQQAYDTEPVEFLLEMPGDVQTFLDRNREALKSLGLREKALKLKDRLLRYLSSNSV
ncbi:hypothetical protein E2P81_ATG05903 [Venturia nashicola]|nr:hypothetical protein E2P81_ATG05903 [Venturia nashicola]